MDLAKLSNQELDKLYSETSSQRDVTQISDEELDKLYYQQQQTRKPRKQIKQEMHPDISTKDRAIVKNFSTNIDTSMKHLRQKYPHLMIDEQDGQILAKKQEEKEWKTLDPDIGVLAGLTGQGGWKEFGRDVLDIAYDVPAALIEGSAMAAAGTAGALGSGGIGAVPAAMAAGGATSAGMEGTRQAMGKALGLEDNISGGQIALAGGLGAVAPGLLGTGAAKKAVTSSIQQGMKGMKGSTKEVIADAIEKGIKDQRGLLGRGYAGFAEKIMPKIAETTSGVKSQSYKTFFKNPSAVKKIADAGDTGTAENTGTLFFDASNNFRKKVIADMDDQLHAKGELIDISKVRDTVYKEHKELAEKQMDIGLFPDQKEKLLVLEEIKKIFQREVKQVDPETKEVVLTMVDIVPKNMPYRTTLKEVNRMTSNLANVSKGFVDPRTKTVSTSVSNHLYGFEKDLYKKTITEVDRVLPEAKSLREAYKKGRELKDWETRHLRNVGQKSVNPHHADHVYDEKGLATLLKVDRHSATHARIKEYDELLRDFYPEDSKNFSLLERARQLRAHKDLYQPKVMPISDTSTSTSKSGMTGIAGAAAGAYLAGQMGVSPWLGLGLGGAIGSSIGGPMAMKGYRQGVLGAERGLGRMHELLAPSYLPAAARQGVYKPYLYNQRKGTQK